MRKTFDLPITSSGVYQEVKTKKMKTGFKPLIQADIESIIGADRITQNQLRNMFSPQGEPRLYHKRGQPAPVIMNAQLRDYKSEEQLDEVEKIKREKEQKYLHSTGRTDALFNVPEVDAQITKVNKALDRLVGVSKEEKEELRKALLTDIVGRNLNVIKKYQLRELKDPNGKPIKNLMAQLQLSNRVSAKQEDEDEGEEKDSDFGRAKEVNDNAKVKELDKFKKDDILKAAKDLGLQGYSVYKTKGDIIGWLVADGQYNSMIEYFINKNVAPKSPLLRFFDENEA